MRSEISLIVYVYSLAADNAVAYLSIKALVHYWNQREWGSQCSRERLMRVEMRQFILS